MTTLRGGAVYLLGEAASVQFKRRPIYVRLIRVYDWMCPEEWEWIDVYELDERGLAVERRPLFVRPAGMQPVRVRTLPLPKVQGTSWEVPR